MEGNLKNRVILILAVTAVILFVSTISSCGRAIHQRSVWQKEMATRLDLDEKWNKCTEEKNSIDQKLKTLSQDFEVEKVAHQAIKKALLQEQLVNQSLKEELQKVTKLKEALEEDLKEALTSSKASKSRK